MGAGMSEWFRSKHGAPFDPKWGLIAKQAKTSRSVVVSIAWCLMDIASQATNRGDVSGADPEELAVALDIDDGEVSSVLIAMKYKDRFINQDGRITSWEKHQPKWEGESSTDRVRKHREAKKQPSKHGNTVERDETLKHVSCNDETCNTAEQNRTEKNRFPLTPHGGGSGKIERIDEIRNSVWKHHGLTEREISTKLASASADGVSQIASWLRMGLDADRILTAIDRAYTEARDTIRRPWVYLDTVMKTELEKAEDVPANSAADQDELWRNRVGKTWLKTGSWSAMWSEPPDHPKTDVPDRILAEFGLMRKDVA